MEKKKNQTGQPKKKIKQSKETTILALKYPLTGPWSEY